jgi:hypothetical protein
MNKRSIILAIIAIFILLCYAQTVGIILLFLFIPYFIFKWQDKRKAASGVVESPDFNTLEEVTEKLGEPSDIVTLSAIHGNELTGVILIYDNAQQMIINGNTYPFTDIKDISYINGANPYVAAEYQVIIITVKMKIRLDVGYDNQYAYDIVIQLRSHLAG